MKKVTLFYLFLQTLALFMLLNILSGNPNDGNLNDFERFGYAVAAFGISLMLGLLIKKRFPEHIETPHQVLLTIGIYPIMLFIVHTAVTSSPELIAEQNRPAALQQGVKTLSGKKHRNADFNTQFTAVTARFPVPDEQVRRLYLESVQGLSKLILKKDVWSRDFTEEQLIRARTGLYYQNNKQSSYENRLVRSYASSMLSGGVFPLTSRTLAQVGQLHRVENGQLKSFHIELTQALMQGLKLVSYSYPVAELADTASNIKFEREDFIRTKRMLLQFQQQIKAEQGFKNFQMLTHKPGRTFDDTVKQSLTAHILKEADIPTANIPDGLMLPLRAEGHPYQADAELTQLIQWLAPYMFNEHGRLIIPIAYLGNPERVRGYEQHLSAELPAGLKDNFKRFYNSNASNLATSASAWQSPIAMELYGHYLRIGKILPWLLLFSFLLLVTNFIRVSCSGFKSCLLASASIFSAFILFHTPLLPWIIRPVLWVSV